jgi:hypothetical protein
VLASCAMNDTKVERPTVITVICVLMALGAVATVPMVMMAASQLPGWYTPFVLASAAVGLVCMVGLWTMRKWAVYLYTAMTVVGQVVLFATGLWVAQSIVVPAIVIAVMFSQLGKMR